MEERLEQFNKFQRTYQLVKGTGKQFWLNKHLRIVWSHLGWPWPSSETLNHGRIPHLALMALGMDPRARPGSRKATPPLTLFRLRVSMCACKGREILIKQRDRFYWKASCPSPPAAWHCGQTARRGGGWRSRQGRWMRAARMNRAEKAWRPRGGTWRWLSWGAFTYKGSHIDLSVGRLLTGGTRIWETAWCEASGLGTWTPHRPPSVCLWSCGREPAHSL